MSEHQVQQGECLSSIAANYNFLWTTLWNDPHNAALKTERQNPNILYPGDVVYIPDTAPKQESRPTDAQHVFQLDDDDCKLRIRLLRNGKPRAGESYQLYIDGDMINGQTDGDGWIERPIPPNAKEGRLVLPETNEEEVLRLGHLDPIKTISGIQQRLLNLGYDIGESADGVLGPDTKNGVGAFQKKYSLKVDGDPGPVTQAKLKEIYGS